MNENQIKGFEYAIFNFSDICISIKDFFNGLQANHNIKVFSQSDLLKSGRIAQSKDYSCVIWATKEIPVSQGKVRVYHGKTPWIVENGWSASYDLDVTSKNSIINSKLPTKGEKNS